MLTGLIVGLFWMSMIAPVVVMRRRDILSYISSQAEAPNLLTLTVYSAIRSNPLLDISHRAAAKFSVAGFIFNPMIALSILMICLILADDLERTIAVITASAIQVLGSLVLVAIVTRGSQSTEPNG